MKITGSLFAVLAAAAGLAACDRSPQNADGATQAGDPGVSTATPSGAPADTGRDTGARADIGGAGQVAEPGGATTAGGATSPKSQ